MKGEIFGGDSVEATEVTNRGRRSKLAYKVFNASASPRGRISGASIPIVTITESDLVDQGGQYRLKGGDAIPMVKVSGKRIKGGGAMVVYPVDANGDYDNTF